jgi:hypothetical protein
MYRSTPPNHLGGANVLSPLDLAYDSSRCDHRVFVDLPIISNYAFWIMAATYLMWLVVNHAHTTRRFRFQLMLTIILTMISVVAAFVGIPIVSDYAFWVKAETYLMIVASTDLIRYSE